MWNKPFKAPAFKRAPLKPAETELIDCIPSTPPSKKRRLVHIIDDDEEPSIGPPVVASTALSIASRKPLLTVVNPIAAVQSSSSHAPEGYYMVLWYVPSLGVDAGDILN